MQNFEFPLEHQYWLLPGREKCGGWLLGYFNTKISEKH